MKQTIKSLERDWLESVEVKDRVLNILPRGTLQVLRYWLSDGLKLAGMKEQVCDCVMFHFTGLSPFQGTEVSPSKCLSSTVVSPVGF